jgi:hypothetical protein
MFRSCCRPSRAGTGQSGRGENQGCIAGSSLLPLWRSGLFLKSGARTNMWPGATGSQRRLVPHAGSATWFWTRDCRKLCACVAVSMRRTTSCSTPSGSRQETGSLNLLLKAVVQRMIFTYKILAALTDATSSGQASSFRHDRRPAGHSQTRKARYRRLRGNSRRSGGDTVTQDPLEECNIVVLRGGSPQLPSPFPWTDRLRNQEPRRGARTAVVTMQSRSARSSPLTLQYRHDHQHGSIRGCFHTAAVLSPCTWLERSIRLFTVQHHQQVACVPQPTGVCSPNIPTWGVITHRSVSKLSGAFTPTSAEHGHCC